MTQLAYAQMVRSMHRIAGWCFIGSIIFAPLGIWILRRGNKIYTYYTTPQSERDNPAENRVLEGNGVQNSLIMSWDDVRDFNDSI